jgi:murein DD-endopeptidase MepM/ murein hydrolase activator NlpD
MSAISNIIFNGANNYITSPYGKRSTISTSAGTTTSFHYGTDYGTNNKNLPQYAIEDGTVISCGTASDSAKYVWIKYPRINKKMLHYHLDSIKVTNGQQVSKGTLIGYTGKTGKATGIHLHLGVKDLTTDKYEDPEAFSKKYEASLSDYTNGTYTVTASLLRVRSTAGILLPYRKFKSLTANAQAQILQHNNSLPADGLVKGCVCSVTKISGKWGKIPSGWICLDYCARV